MPLFHRRSEDEKHRESVAREERAASTVALEKGGIPVPAQRRLQALRAREQAMFTSDLSVAEFLLAKQSGIIPLSQVMGSSVYHVGWQYIQSWSGSGELSTISDAFNAVRTRALGRMAQEAELVGADVVLGVQVVSQYLEPGKVVEFQAVGTAARVEGGQRRGKTTLTNLSGQDLWKLRASGYWPVGVAAASTVYHVVPSWGTQYATSGWGGWSNQELTDFTQGLYHARGIAMSRAQAQGMNFPDSIGMVGVAIEQTQQEYEVKLNNDQERKDMIFTFHVLGTVIAKLREFESSMQTSQTLNLKP